MTTAPADLTVRAIAADELEAFRGCVMDVFGMDPEVDPHGADRLRALLDPARTYGAFDGGRLVATAAAYPFELAVCGGGVAMAGLTMVTVRPTHRRRGLLRRLIAAHVADAAAHGEPVSGLWASDGGIYGRFGYGVAAESDEVTLGPDAGLAAAGGDTLELLDDAAATTVLPPVYAAALALRPGMFARSPAWWRWRRFTDRVDVRRGRSPRRHVVSRRGAAVTGYVVYRQKLGFDDGGRPAGALDVEELVALDGEAEASLWRHVTTVDLFPKVTYWNAPTDAVAPWRAADRRAVARRHRADTLWLRLGDIAAALAARRYLADGGLRLGVRVPDTAELVRCELAVAGAVGQCALTTAAPELEVDLGALGAIYLGGAVPSQLARAGVIRGDADVLARADALFRWPVAPWCPEVF